jgi:hypothetical protein
MIPQAKEHKARPSGRVLPFASTDEANAKSTAARKNSGQHKHAAAAKSATHEATEAMDAAVTPALSKRVQNAFKDDTDPSKSLADIRGLLMGPISRLHEARMEEIIAILEESDRATQSSLRALDERCNSLAETNQNLINAANETNQTVQTLAVDMAVELQKAAKHHDNKLNELFMSFESKMEKLATELNHRIDALASKTDHNQNALATSLATRIDDLTTTTVNNDERIVTHFESQLALMEDRTDSYRSKQIEAFADGFTEFADRVMALRGPKTR